MLETHNEKSKEKSNIGKEINLKQAINLGWGTC